MIVPFAFLADESCHKDGRHDERPIRSLPGPRTVSFHPKPRGGLYDKDFRFCLDRALVGLFDPLAAHHAPRSWLRQGALTLFAHGGTRSSWVPPMFNVPFNHNRKRRGRICDSDSEK